VYLKIGKKFHIFSMYNTRININEGPVHKVFYFNVLIEVERKSLIAFKANKVKLTQKNHKRLHT
jgi:hypothetical protein